MGPPVVKSLRPVTELPLETHLMITDPDLYVEAFAEAGSDSLLVHYEGNNNLHRTIQQIKSLGKQAGVVINPATPATVLEEILAGRRPGAGDDRQSRLRRTRNSCHTTLPKIAQVREMIERHQSQMRAGTRRRHRSANRQAGRKGRANVLVAGSSVFGARRRRMQKLHNAVA